MTQKVQKTMKKMFIIICQELKNLTSLICPSPYYDTLRPPLLFFIPILPESSGILPKCLIYVKSLPEIAVFLAIRFKII